MVLMSRIIELKNKALDEMVCEMVRKKAILLSLLLVHSIAGCAATPVQNTAPVVEKSPIKFVDGADKKVSLAASSSNSSVANQKEKSSDIKSDLKKADSKLDKPSKTKINSATTTSSSVKASSGLVSVPVVVAKPIETSVVAKRSSSAVPAVTTQTNKTGPAFASKPAPQTITHVVKPQETLFSIALRYDTDYQQLAKQNKIEPPFTIQVGQKLRITNDELPVVDVASSGAKKVGITPSSAATNPIKETPLSAASNQAKASSAITTSTVIKNVPLFAWPYNGNVSVRFRDNNSKGIVIEKSSQDQVLAVADGKVLYAGSGLRGYGNLLIIKHNEQWLSAYAHNKRLLVKEGQSVKQGQAVALIGQSEAPRPVAMLHFELRYLGKPVDPLLYLPAR